MLLERGLKRGAVGDGFGLAYTPGATMAEVLDMFRIAAANNASRHVHLRGASSAVVSEEGRLRGLAAVIAALAITGAPLQVVHINSSGQESTTKMLDAISGARKRGLDVTTEAYPYGAGARASSRRSSAAGKRSRTVRFLHCSGSQRANGSLARSSPNTVRSAAS